MTPITLRWMRSLQNIARNSSACFLIFAQRKLTFEATEKRIVLTHRWQLRISFVIVVEACNGFQLSGLSLTRI
jgi:hypothetical protein